MLLGLLFSLQLLFVPQYKIEPNYTFVFYRIDNKVDIVVNDSLVFSSQEVDGNPNLEGIITAKIGQYMTQDKNKIVIKLYNGFDPYPEYQKDKHWEIEYSLFKDEKEIDFMWNEGDDYRVGLVFEETYHF